MKRILTSVGLVALSASGLHAAMGEDGLSRQETSKPWSISAALRGFYDDNYTTSPRALRRDSYGFQVTPTASLNLPLDQTFIGASYTYDLRWYDDRVNHKDDQSHQFTAKLDHAFTERYKVELSDSFVIAQEPTVIDPSGIITVPLRTEGDNIRNTAQGNLQIQLTERLQTEIGYANNYYDYDEAGFAGSHSALLDRMEQTPSISLRVQIQPTTIGVIGYQFNSVDYSSRDSLIPGPVFVDPKLRNNDSHYAFVGVDQALGSQLNVSARVGAQYIEYDRLNQSTVSPYADANLTYHYSENNSIVGGVRHARNQTDFAGTVGSLTLDQESTSVYATISHKITAKLTLNLLGQYQHSTFRGGLADGASDDFFIAGANLAFMINQFLSAEGGYNFDKLDSDLGGRGYTRNRIYIGLRALY